MKKYFFGIIAVIIATGSVAFTKVQKANKKDLATYTFRYKPTSDFTQNSVQTNNNWESGIAGCGGSLDACTMEVTDTYTHLDGTKRVLNTTGNVINIVATGSGSDFQPNPSASTGVQSATNQN